ncbi:GTP-binding protein YsxC [Phycomyces blakesleeanus]|uniref:GTP-binding protein 8 n=2 Tax=Phycomyces blakesleeanus TaxID=4837 RepID=A0A162PVH4_PHYB8|nr:hypothetical protein PHYBLDRAFT_166348 [Phycomyces blakesleeanus NRRL 1555(-)]OAD76377.1 hypothetical protein PHYBLDRAFT_166348 [Phycomyces blakesleeanus NRRL 1555(-)]|eukprot:XP_018294417.1 hypothetical protein PHYBLDRAFT_166348 [Phycomyces blakesleeanus NRRL 1555(-)]
MILQRFFSTSLRSSFPRGVNSTTHLTTKNSKSFKLVSFPEPPELLPKDKSFGNRTFARPVQFIKSVSSLEQAPARDLPEVAFVGRSNVGKSTLINYLTNNHNLVKTSSKPGHTRLLNFFNVSDKCTLVDMPGYGFRSREEWGDLIIDYLTNRKQLKRLFILVDPTAGLKDTDKQLMEMLDKQAVSYQIILTKKDRLNKEAFETSKSTIERYLVDNAICCYPELLSAGKARRSKNNTDQTAEDITRVRWAVLSAAGVNA